MRNKSGFGLLTYLVGSFSGSHNVSYLITPLESKVTMIVYYVLQDKEKKIQNGMKKALRMNEGVKSFLIKSLASYDAFMCFTEAL